MSLATSPARCRRYSRGPSEPFSPEFGFSRLGLARARFASTFVVAPSSSIRPTMARDWSCCRRPPGSRPPVPDGPVPGTAVPVPSGLLLRCPPGCSPPGCRPPGCRAPVCRSPDCRPPVSARPVPGNTLPVQVRLLSSMRLDESRAVCPGPVRPSPPSSSRLSSPSVTLQVVVLQRPPDQSREIRSRSGSFGLVMWSSRSLVRW